MFGWVLRLIGLGRSAWWFASGGAASVGLGVVAFSTAHPLWAGVAFTVGAFALVGAATILAFGYDRGVGSPRYLRWLEFPFHPVSWRRFGIGIAHPLGARSQGISSFHFEFRPNAERIRPERFFLEFDSGKDIDLLITHAHKATAKAEEIENLPGKRWYNGAAMFRQRGGDSIEFAPTADEFFREYGAFNLILRYEGKEVRHRFSYLEIRIMIESHLSRAQRAERVARLRAS